MANTIIIVSISDEASYRIDNLSYEELSVLGIDTDLNGKFRYSYVSVYDKSTGFHYEELSEGEIKFNELRNQLPVWLEVVSLGSFTGPKAYSSIKINGVEYSKNARGLNIVIYDKKIKSVVDSFSVDTYGDPTLTIRR